MAPDLVHHGDEVVVLTDAVREGDRSAIAQAITLVESRRPQDRVRARALLAAIGAAGGSDGAAPTIRVGISGVPGAGKSTFIDQLGVNLIADGHRVAVLAVDPSSARSGGSILGDRTRMARLAADAHAFVRPSPAAGTLGGVAAATREAMLIMEAAGYDVVLVETVGVGQSEHMVADMVDTFVYLTLARTGDQLQGMKRGILELADVIAVNKADGADAAGRAGGVGVAGTSAGGARAHADESARAARELSAALRLLRGPQGAWQPPVITCSGLHNVNVDRVWALVRRHRDWLESSAGGLAGKRMDQRVAWTRALVRDRLLARLDASQAREAVAVAEAAVRSGELTPDQAADRILVALAAH